MNYANEFLDQISDEKKEIQLDNLRVVGRQFYDDMVEIEEISVDITYGSDLRPVCEKLVEQLNDASNSVGKEWEVLEFDQESSTIVSSVYAKKETQHRFYSVTVTPERIVFKSYDHDNQLIPTRKEGTAKMFTDEVEGLIDALILPEQSWLEKIVGDSNV